MIYISNKKASLIIIVIAIIILFASIGIVKTITTARPKNIEVSNNISEQIDLIVDEENKRDTSKI